MILKLLLLYHMCICIPPCHLIRWLRWPQWIAICDAWTQCQKTRHVVSWLQDKNWSSKPKKQKIDPTCRKSTLNCRCPLFPTKTKFAPGKGVETAIVLVTQSILLTKHKVEDGSSVAIVSGNWRQPFIFSLATHQTDRNHKHVFLRRVVTFGC